MKYIVLKNSPHYLCVQLPEEFSKKLEIAYFENQKEFDDFLKDNTTTLCQVDNLSTIYKKEEPEYPSDHMQDGLFIRQNDYFKKVLFRDILWVEASRSYSYIHTVDNQRMILTCPLAEVRKKLPKDKFVQPHRSFLLNINYVNRYIGNMLYIDKQSFPISRKLKKSTLSKFLFLDSIKELSEKDLELED